jgi:hypothetical protein
MFRKDAEFKIVQEQERPQTEEAIESLKERWRKALQEYASGRFSDKIRVFNGQAYYIHEKLSMGSSNPNVSTLSFVGVNEDMQPVLANVTIKCHSVGGAPIGVEIDVQPKVLTAKEAESLGLTPEHVIKILRSMEKSSL